MHAVVFDIVDHETLLSGIKNLSDGEIESTVRANLILSVFKLSFVKFYQLLDFHVKFKNRAAVHFYPILHFLFIAFLLHPRLLFIFLLKF